MTFKYPQQPTRSQIKWLYSTLLLMISGFNASIFANQPEPQKEQRCAQLHSIQWLLGQWQETTDKTITHEQWDRIDDAHFSGVGTTVRVNSKKPPFVEALEIVKMAGAIYYIAKPPQNSLPIAFELVSCSDQYLKFINPTHDFPSVIEYRKINQEQMIATVSGDDNKGFEIHFVRQANTNNPNGGNKVAIVTAYVDAYNQRDLAAMLKHTSADIRWMSVNGDQVTTETADRVALKAALQQHFTRPSAAHSQLLTIGQYGNYVSAIEKVSSTKDGKPREQCSLSIYRFNAATIEAVWYYPAQNCQ